MKILGIIPARGGSKRFLRKNLATLGPKPLVCWAIDTAVESKVFNKILVSTEDEQIGKLSNVHAGFDIWWKRNPRIAQDDTPMVCVLEEIADVYDAYDVYAILQPTSPFRTAKHIQDACSVLETSGGDSVISVTKGEEDLAFELGHAKRLRGVPDVYIANGAIYLITAEALNRGETWYSGLVYAYTMDKDESLDIDTGLDMEIARHIYSMKR